MAQRHQRGWLKKEKRAQAHIGSFGLQWNDVNFADGMIHVRGTWTCGQVGLPKSKASKGPIVSEGEGDAESVHGAVQTNGDDQHYRRVQDYAV